MFRLSKPESTATYDILVGRGYHLCFNTPMPDLPAYTEHPHEKLQITRDLQVWLLFTSALLL